MPPLLHQLFGSPTGQLGIYGGLFTAFLLFTGFVYVAEVPAIPERGNRELALQEQELLYT